MTSDKVTESGRTFMSHARGRRVLDLLAPWRLPGARIGREMTDLGDRSRVWRLDTDIGPYVAKLTFDHPAVVEPGLEIAAVLDRAGIPTGAPIPAADGRLCRSVGRLGRRPWTLALHEFVPGAPLDLAGKTAPEQAGDLLGRVHHALATHPDVPQPAGHLLDFYTAEADRLSGPRGTALGRALAAITDFRAHTRLSDGVLYGDPAPEILVDANSTELALIDWGTPSYGPLLHDIVSWQLFLTSHQTPEAATTVEQRFLAAYRDRCPIDDHQLAGRNHFLDLHHAIQDAWMPEPPQDAAW
ncbi:phosphotransferase enzyme family protein [Streptomyces sp. NPDC018833]|uniref:phosphotransferase enzyme family protein n=1 Tax=Streptomyces sp. NPDC018833 TaxID=3365053 RepID=UPI0037B9DE2F